MLLPFVIFIGAFILPLIMWADSLHAQVLFIFIGILLGWALAEKGTVKW